MDDGWNSVFQREKRKRKKRRFIVSGGGEEFSRYGVGLITTQKVLFYTFKSLCFKHFCVVILHLYSNWHVKDLAMTPNHICG